MKKMCRASPRFYAAPSSQGRVCAEIGSDISEQRRLLHYCGLPSRNDDGFRDFAWQKSASLHSHESRACHWAARDTAIRPLCHSGTIGWHRSDPRWTCRRFSFIITHPAPLPPPPSLPPLCSTMHPDKSKQTKILAARASHHHHSFIHVQQISTFLWEDASLWINKLVSDLYSKAFVIIFLYVRVALM